MASNKVGTNEYEMQAGLTEAIQDISQQGYAQFVALQEKQQTLICLQATLSSTEKKGEEAELELKSTVRQILVLEAEMEDLQRRMCDLTSRSLAAYNQNTGLTLQLEEEEDRSIVNMKECSTYRNKMEDHRAAVSHAESLTVAHKELEEKRTLVRALTERREELRADLRNPEGKAVKQAQKEIDELREQIAALRKMVPEKREQLLKEFENHSHIKKDIEIQNRRYEAIVKRLHCQLKKAQSSHQQISADIYHMERQIEELKRQLATP